MAFHNDQPVLPDFTTPALFTSCKYMVDRVRKLELQGTKTSALELVGLEDVSDQQGGNREQLEGAFAKLLLGLCKVKKLVAEGDEYDPRIGI